MKIKPKLKKSIAIFALLLILVQNMSFFPFAVSKAIADETIPLSSTESSITSPTPIDTIAPTPPQDSVTPTPEVLVTPTDTATPAPTDNPADTVTPTPTTVDNLSPPNTTSPVPTSTETSNITSSEKGNLSAVILKNVSAPSLDLTVPTSQTSASLTTDKADYAPTDTALITGSNLLPNTTYTLRVWSDDQPPTSTTVEVTSDENGVFAYAYQLDGTYRPNYSAELRDSSGTVVATVTFTDSISAQEYSQCSNDTGTGYTSVDTGCRWINGNLQKNNSRYFEGDATPQRLHLNNLSNGPHTVQIKYGTSKGGKHAYDFITDDIFSESWITNADFCEGLSGFSNCSTSTLNTSSLIPTDSNAGGFDVAQANRHFKIRNGTITSIGTPTLASGSYAGNSETTILITFSVNTATCIDKNASNNCPVLITWGAHVSRQQDWGTGNSAVNISGSPYHVALDTMDGGSAGSRDNQMQADAIPPFPGLSTQISSANITLGNSVTDTANYTVVGNNGNVTGTTQFYVCGPGSVIPCTSTSTPVGGPVTNSSNAATSSSFTPNATGTYCFAAYYSPDATAQYSPTFSTVTTNECVTVSNPPTGTLIVNKVTNPANDTTQFSITATGSGTITAPASRTTLATNHSESFTVTQGNYWVAETVPAGWSKTGDTCQNVFVPSGQTVNCTITNTKKGHIIVDKVTNPSGDNQSFTFTTTGTGYNGFSLTDQATPNDQELVPGTYSVAETVPTGWTQTSAVCDNQQTPGSITLSAGQTITCTFNNTKKGHLIVQKTTFPSGDQTVFTINATGNGTITNGGTGTITDANDKDYEVTPGTYSVSETVPSGWSKTGDTCQNVVVAAGETVNCLLTNTKLGSIIVKKSMVGGTDSFTFTGSPSGTISSNDGTLTVNNVLPGTYTSTEGTKTGWDLTSIVCDDGASTVPSTGNVGTRTASFNVEANEIVTCTFTNTKRAHIVIVKDVIGNPDPTDFTFNNNFANGNPATFLLDEDDNGTLPSSRDFEVLPETYAVSEDPVTDWQLESTSCTNGETIDNIDVAPGETVTCTFVNEELVEIVLVKNTIGGNGDFDFDATGAGLPADIDLTTVAGTATQTFTGLDQDNTYSIAENVPAGWDLTSAACDKGETPNDIDIEPGETVTCTFTNTKKPTLEVFKVCEPVTDGGKFNLFIDSNQITSDTICGGSTNGQIEVSIGTHSVSETAGSGTSLANYDSVISGNCNADGNVTLAAGENKSCTITNSRLPKLTVTKVLSPSNDPGLFNLEIDSTEYATDVGDGGSTGPQQVSIGTHSASETVGTGTDLSNYTKVVGGDCDPNGDIALAAGDIKTCTITNTRQQGTLLVNKEVDTDGDDTYDVTDNATANGLGFRWGFDSTPSNNTNSFGVGETLNTDTYDVFENEVTDYHFTGWYDNSGDGSCEEPDDTSLPANVNVNYNETTEITLCNQRDTGSVKVNKLLDNDGDGTYELINPNIFTWTLDGGSANQMGATVSPVTTGSHNVNENSPAGYGFTGWFYGDPIENQFNCQEPEFTTALPATVDVLTDQLTELTLCNQLQNPILTITKQNSALGDLGPGADVLYTITIAATQSSAQSVKVIDLLPDGFKYKDGSWTASSNVNPGLVVPEPIYASPGVWNLGNMVAGETITLTLIATINGGQQPGLYKDVAWAQGSSLASSTVLAQAQNPGFVDTNFVGTQVNVVKEESQAPSLAKQGEVLGVSTSLPATGANTNWTLFAIAILLLGLNMVAAGFIIRKRYV